MTMALTAPRSVLETGSSPPPSSSHSHASTPTKDINQNLKDLEVHLLASLTRVVSEAIQALKHVEAELQSVRIEVADLTTRVLKLEEDVAQKYRVGSTYEANISRVEMVRKQ